MQSCIATGLSSKKPASSTDASKRPSSSRSNPKPSQKPKSIPLKSAKAKSSPKLSQAASRTRGTSDQLKSTPEPQQLRRSLRLQKKSELLTVLRQQRKARMQTTRSLSPADPPCVLTAAGPESTPQTASASPPGARPTPPTGPPCDPPPVSAGPPSTASISSPLFFKIGPGLIHPHLKVFEGVPNNSNILRRELGRYITTNFCPVDLGGWGYVHCLWMYEDYQRAMVLQGRTVVVSPSVFSVLVPEICERHWGIVLDKSSSRYGSFGDSKFQFCFVGIMPRHKK